MKTHEVAHDLIPILELFLNNSISLSFFSDSSVVVVTVRSGFLFFRASRKMCFLTGRRNVVVVGEKYKAKWTEL